ncbi:MAG: NTP transferase domain-containing protein, partial [Halobacteriovoraceae bacterium]|nr:NTP transferase domain-containing protein [Halobacteriovoraceae bacterium]
MADKIGVAILAAGMGKRMGVSTAKPLIPLMGRCLVDYTIDAAKNFGNSIGATINLGVVVGHQKENVEAHVSQVHSALSPAFPVQEKQLGTADALKSYFKGCPWSEETDYTIVLCADTPLLTEEELATLWSEMQTNKLDAVAATFSLAKPFGYGRILRSKKGFKIVEEKDATDIERRVDEVNSGLYIFKTKEIKEALGQINSENKAGEFYLTDVFQQDKNVGAIHFEDPKPFQGINNPQQLSSALHDLKIRINRGHQANGVLVLDTAHTYIEPSVKIGMGTTVFANAFLHGDTVIGEGVTLEPGCIIKDSKIDDGVKVKAYS